MLVRAIRIGYYDHKRRFPLGDPHRNAGVPFEVKAEDFSKRWMEQVSGNEPPPKPVEDPSVGMEGRPKGPVPKVAGRAEEQAKAEPEVEPTPEPEPKAKAKGKAKGKKPTGSQDVI